MAESIVVSGISKEEKYQSLLPQLKALVDGETDVIANISNIMAALKFAVESTLWVGVYFVKHQGQTKELILGPFQGPVACTRIAYGRGVCGKAWEKKATIIVDDVDSFPGHIACSSLSKSEIVIPVFDINGDVMLVIDVDSDQLAAFDKTDKAYLEQVGTIIAGCMQP